MAKEKRPSVALKYIHMRSEQGKGSVSCGYTVDVEGKSVSYTVARCAAFDNFCRKIGRDICQGRYTKFGPSGTFKFEKYEDIKAFFLANHHPDVYVSAPGDAKQAKVYDNFSYMA